MSKHIGSIIAPKRHKKSPVSGAFAVIGGVATTA